MGLIINSTINKAQYAAGFNQGMEQATSTISLMIQVLVMTFALKVIVNFPPISKRINQTDKYNLVEIIEFSADVLAFFVTIMMFWTLQGNALIK
jgi:hypothetical protein